jgi:uncharacterized protein
MMIDDRFTPLLSTIGGLLIGLSASALLLCNGRIAGVSGIFGRALTPRGDDPLFRPLFLAGLLAGGLVILALRPAAFGGPSDAPLPLIGLSGLLVGFGTRLGSGCTSGHGVCGIARLSLRSIVATGVFMATAVAAVLVQRHLLGAGQ